MQTMPSKPFHYHAYLLRIWHAQGADENVTWQASLQDAATRQRIGFASLEGLFAFLLNEIEVTPERRALESDTETHG